MRKEFLIILILVLFYLNSYSQTMELKFKNLKYSDLNTYLKEHHGKFVENTFCNFYNYYECDDQTLLIENTIEKTLTLYFDREKLYQGEKEIQKWAKNSPLKSKQKLLSNFENNKEIILSELFDNLKINRPSTLTKINLKTINNAIKKYGYEDAFERLSLNLIVFAGEYIRESKGGKWLIESSPSYPSEIEPIFMDNEKRSYRFEINNLLFKNFYEKGKIDINDIIQLALLPSIFEVVPNTYGKNF